MAQLLHEIDKIEIITLQDNIIDLLQGDNSSVIKRALPIRGNEMGNSILAEHGFSSLIRLTENGSTRSLLFDFGYSRYGAAFNADALGLDLSSVEVMALSHGHMDHTGGLFELTKRVNRPGIGLLVHPSVFKVPRYIKINEENRIYFPAFTREQTQVAGVGLIETEIPYALLDGAALFLGEIPRNTDFEKTPASFHYEKAGEEKQDTIEDDTALAFHIKGKGLVVLTGCAHSGIINTVEHAQRVTGINKIYAVMGGFHLAGADFEGIIRRTTQRIMEMDPVYIVPTHCTGRTAILHMERQMPDQFILNMSGTTLTFSS